MALMDMDELSIRKYVNCYAKFVSNNAGTRAARCAAGQGATICASAIKFREGVGEIAV